MILNIGEKEKVTVREHFSALKFELAHYSDLNNYIRLEKVYLRVYFE